MLKHSLKWKGKGNPACNPEIMKRIIKTMTGRTLSNKHKQAIKDGLTGREGSKGEKNPKSKTWTVKFPDGHKELIKGLRAFCRLYCLNEKLMRKTSRGEAAHHKHFCLEKYEEDTCSTL
jgi:hypothetical protein